MCVCVSVCVCTCERCLHESMVHVLIYVIDFYESVQSGAAPNENLDLVEPVEPRWRCALYWVCSCYYSEKNL